MKSGYSIILLALFTLFISCEEDNERPVLKSSSTFVAPSLKNAASADPMVFTPENAGDQFEVFEWERADYGVKLSTVYVLQVDTTEAFANPQTLAQSSGTSTPVTVEAMNNAMLGLGLPGFEESNVYIRLRATINGYESDSLYSNVVERTATTYQNSECGNFCTIGLIGSASPGGWDVDVDMRLADATAVDKSTWTVTVYLTAGAVKFRASDDWTDNWGDTAYPSGTGTANGPDIPIATAGYYKVTFNDNTGDYTFTPLSAPTFGTIGLIGPAQAGGWDADTDLTQDGTNPHVWTGVITLTEGEAKFRADDDWASNWGAETYPSGVGIGNGPNVPVAAGTYFVWFNDVTGEYAFMAQANSAPYDAVGLIGPAQGGGWDTDTDLVQNPANPYLWSKMMTVAEDEAKFRADDDWAVNWGGTGFPGGVGIQNGPNIPAKAGTYFIKFHTGTGQYYFLK